MLDEASWRSVLHEARAGAGGRRWVRPAGGPRGVHAETARADAPWNLGKAAPEGAIWTAEARDKPQLVSHGGLQ